MRTGKARRPDGGQTNVPDLTTILDSLAAGKALDLACGKGRHAAFLAERGWAVTAVDLVPAEIPGVTFIEADLEKHGFAIEPGAYDLILAWLYWQPGLLPAIAEGVRPGGIAALAGKTEGRFATSLGNYRRAFPGWSELAAGEGEGRVWFVARAPYNK
ncbi:MAG: class I SAM-dependent methyltransferase [Acidobacteriota bacterium]|nr:class I SAM-dependent methyltransferase [Acidobacteriota bacterium]